MTEWDDIAASSSVEDGWPETDPAAEAEAASSPNWLLIAASGAVAVGVIALMGGIALNLVGYLASSLLASTLVAFFRRRSVRRSSLVGISTPRHLNLIALTLLTVGFALSLVHAWLIASYLS
jgi:hypothetical protein